jgi:lysophospholipase L1-like esterase
LAGLANGSTVFIGDTGAYDWFRQNPWHLDGGGSGFHPDQEGYRVLGELWAAAFQSIVENSAP